MLDSRCASHRHDGCKHVSTGAAIDTITSHRSPLLLMCTCHCHRECPAVDAASGESAVVCTCFGDGPFRQELGLTSNARAHKWDPEVRPWVIAAIVAGLLVAGCALLAGTYPAHGVVDAESAMGAIAVLVAVSVVVVILVAYSVVGLVLTLVRDRPGSWHWLGYGTMAVVFGVSIGSIAIEAGAATLAVGPVLVGCALAARVRDVSPATAQRQRTARLRAAGFLALATLVSLAAMVLIPA